MAEGGMKKRDQHDFKSEKVSSSVPAGFEHRTFAEGGPFPALLSLFSSFLLKCTIGRFFPSSPSSTHFPTAGLSTSHVRAD